MSLIRSAVAANLVVIQQGPRLLSALGDARYTQRQPLCFDSAIGGHMRHIIEHYLGFLAGLDRQEINYEERARDPHIESDAVYASSVLDSIAERLEQFARAGTNETILVHAETAPDGETSVASSFVRELEFLLSHTIHHYALIAVMARVMGVEPEPTFGRAPSTMKYERSRAASSCAR
jgi:uncharacterized damage-inducible protein DinB